MSEKERRILEQAWDREMKFRHKSDYPLRSICCRCRVGTNLCHQPDHSSFHYQVGWKFEYPKKRDKKAWAKLEKALENGEIVPRIEAVIPPSTDSELFSWAHLYNSSNNITRTNYPRHRKYRIHKN